MFFFLSKISWALASPSTLLLLAGAIALSVQAFKQKQKAWRYAVGLLGAIFLFIVILPVGDWLLYPLEHRLEKADASNIDGILVLGGAIDIMQSHESDGVSIRAAAERMTVLPELHRKFPQAIIVFTGGPGDVRHPELNEADYAEKLLREWGIGNAIYERKSRNTFENAAYSKEMLQPKANEKWLLVTSAAHMRRAVAVFEKRGWPVLPYPVDYTTRQYPDLLCFCAAQNLFKLDNLAYELIGILIYKLTGKA
ncbi:MAG: hypothetical protein JWM96_449 [Alphaproteobacteria bacterium]|nr:hypothetical protein [Alphaproteobacteria bacterium]